MLDIKFSIDECMFLSAPDLSLSSQLSRTNAALDKFNPTNRISWVGAALTPFQARPTMITPAKIRAMPTSRGLEISRSIQIIETSAVIRMLICRKETT